MLFRQGMLQPAGTEGKKPNSFPYTLLFPFCLYYFLTPAPLFRSDPFSIVPSFSTVLAAAIQSLQGSRRLKVSLEQSPPNVVHCARFSSAAINPLPLLPATPGGGSPPGGISPWPVMLRARSS